MPDGERIESATFEIRPLGRGRSRSPLVALGWAAALVALVGIGVLGRSPAYAQGPAPAPAGLVAVDAPAAEPSPTGLRVVDAIDLRVPAAGPVVVSSPRLAIWGTVLVRADHVVIALEARNNRVLEETVVDVTIRDGMLRPDRSPSFGATFDLPFPRPNDTMWVVVTAVDSRGVPVGGIRRPFLVGAIEEQLPVGDQAVALVGAARFGLSSPTRLR